VKGRLLFLGLSLYMKYRRAKNPKEFVTKNWQDVLMFASLPLFTWFAVAKVAVKVVKCSAKLSKWASRRTSALNNLEGRNRQDAKVDRSSVKSRPF
jgi:hypothetical protein